MTIHTTTNYGIAYCDTSTAVVDLAAASQQAAETIDAALGRGGIAPPDATSFAAEVAARAAGDSGLSARLALFEQPARAVLFDPGGSGQSIPNAAWTAVQWANPTTSGGTLRGFSWSAANPTRVTCTQAGLYEVQAVAAMSINTAGGRLVGLRKNGADIGSSSGQGAALAGLFAIATSPRVPVQLAAGDYLEAVAYQNSGGALVIAGGGSSQASSLRARWIGVS